MTTSSTWQFLKLQQQIAWLDSDEYDLKELPVLLGILTRMVTGSEARQ